nr:translation initiation factor IF-2 [Oryctolagus cuniculus]XP_051686646.1 translation initiation factor IF-2 [Oryctolagus cuniculus]
MRSQGWPLTQHRHAHWGEARAAPGPSSWPPAASVKAEHWSSPDSDRPGAPVLDPACVPWSVSKVCRGVWRGRGCVGQCQAGHSEALGDSEGGCPGGLSPWTWTWGGPVRTVGREGGHAETCPPPRDSHPQAGQVPPRCGAGSPGSRGRGGAGDGTGLHTEVLEALRRRIGNAARPPHAAAPAHSRPGRPSLSGGPSRRGGEPGPGAPACGLLPEDGQDAVSLAAGGVTSHRARPLAAPAGHEASSQPAWAACMQARTRSVALCCPLASELCQRSEAPSPRSGHRSAPTLLAPKRPSPLLSLCPGELCIWGNGCTHSRAG